MGGPCYLAQTLVNSEETGDVYFEPFSTYIKIIFDLLYELYGFLLKVSDYLQSHVLQFKTLVA